jgi:hypothetical protein
MKKLLTLFMASFFTAKCGDIIKAEKLSDYNEPFKEPEDEDINLKKVFGVKKIGIVGNNFNKPLEGKEVRDMIYSYTYNINTNQIGTNYQYTPGIVQMYSANEYNVDKFNAVKQLHTYKTNIAILKKIILAATSVGSSNSNSKFIILPPNANPNEVFNNQFIEDLYQAFADDAEITPAKLYTKFSQLQRFLGRGVGSVKKVVDTDNGQGVLFATDNINLLFANSNAAINLTPPIYTSYQSLTSSSNIDKILEEAFITLGSIKNLNAIFVQVKDGVFNNEEIYKAIFQDREFEDTELILIGNKAKTQSGSSSKIFAQEGEKITTGSYSKYASNYLAGFRSAVSQLK